MVPAPAIKQLACQLECIHYFQKLTASIAKSTGASVKFFDTAPDL